MTARPPLRALPSLLACLAAGSSIAAQAPDTTIQSNQRFIRYGFYVAGAGDVNGDGFDDLAAAAPLYENGESNEGIVYLHFGSATGVRPLPVWSLEGDQDWLTLGKVASAGDVDGDGYDDLLIGDPDFDATGFDEGRVQLFAGSAAGLGATPTWWHSPSQSGERYGESVGCAGDVNGDGFPDVFVGAPGYDGTASNQGKIYVYHGSPTGFTTESWSVRGSKQDAEFGARLAAAGDVNGDGYDDLLQGQPNFTRPNFPGGVHGRVTLYLGSPTGLSPDYVWKFFGDQNAAQLGFAIDGVGDVNADGFDDFLVGAPYRDGVRTDEGRLYLFLGSPTGPGSAPDWVLDAGFGYAKLGFALAGIGDVNLDGFDDALVGSFGSVVWGFLGGPGGFDAVPLLYPSMGITYAQPTPYFGASLCAAGDVNGDGRPDFAVGAHSFTRPIAQQEEGAVFVYHGSRAALAWPRNPAASTNPVSYGADAPVLGALWNATVNVGLTGHASAFVVGHRAADALELPGGQWSLVGGPRVFSLPWRPGPIASWSIPIPLDPALQAFRVFTQAVHVQGPPPYRLSNAMDLVVGE